MKTYKVQLSREVYQVACVEVEAENAKQAEEIAYDNVSAGFYEDDFDWKDEQTTVEYIKEV